MVGLVGEADERFLARLAQSPNVSVARAPAPAYAAQAPGPAWQAGAEAMREAARRRSTFVLVAAGGLMKTQLAPA